MSEQNPLAAGFFFDRPKEGAPDFVKGKVSVKVAEAIETLRKHENEAGYVNLDLLKSKDGSKLYLTVNTWKPEKPAPRPQETPDESWRDNVQSSADQNF